MDNNTKKRKNGYTALQNIRYIIGDSWAFDKLVFIYFGIYTVLSSISPFVGILFPKFILDQLTGQKDIRTLIMLIAGFFLSSAVIGYFMAYMQAIYYPHMIKIRFIYINRISEKCMTTDFKNTEDPKFLNDLETGFRALESNDKGVEGILHKLFSLGGGFIGFVGYITIVATLSPLVLLYLISNVLISYYFTLSVKRYEHSKKDEVSDNDRRSGYAYNLMYDFSYGKELRIYSLSNWIGNIFKLYKDKRLETHKDIRYRYFKAGLVDILLLLIREGIVYAYLIYLVLTDGLSIGNFTMYFATIAGFAGWMQKIMDDIAHIRAQNLTVNDLRSFLEVEEEKEPKNPMPIPNPPYEIEFKNVSFKYPGSEDYIYKNLSLKIPARQKLAIVGHNGAGKTTFVKLLCRLYEPDEGEILLNGINIQKFSKKEYSELFSAVFQEVKVLAFSVAENIAVCSPEKIDYERVAQCLEKADMSERIASLKNGVHTSMQKFLDDEGIEFSGGENQKISLARALYKDGDIIILDEPTAALDALAEYKTYTRFNDVTQDKTAIYISHRLASTRFCDKIAMFENGRLVEYGTHKELLGKGGKYADMFNIQAQYYKDGEAIRLEGA